MMLDYTEFRRIVESYIGDNYTETAIKFENMPINQNTEWIAVFDKQATSESTGMIEQTNLVRGVIIIQIFTGRNIGTQRSREIAQILSDLLGNKSIQGIELDAAGLFTAGLNESFFQQNLQIPYTAVLGQDTSC